MAEQTVNDVIDTSMEAEIVNPENVEDASVEASNEAEQVEDSNDSTDDAGADTTDAVNQGGEDETKQFLESKGVKLDDPEALAKVADMYRNAEKQMNKKSQEAAAANRELERAVGEMNPEAETRALQEIAAMRNQQMTKEFRERTSVSPEVEEQMVNWMEKPVKLQDGSVIKQGYLITNGIISLDDVYRLAGGDTIDPSGLADKVKKQTLAEVANKQSAARGKAAATNAKQFAPAKDDPFTEGMLQALQGHGSSPQKYRLLNCKFNS